MFWPVIDLQTLVLLQDVSDRIEKENEDSELLVSLQKDSIPVVRGDWKVHLSTELQEGEDQEDWKLKLDRQLVSCNSLSENHEPLETLSTASRAKNKL